MAKKKKNKTPASKVAKKKSKNGKVSKVSGPTLKKEKTLNKNKTKKVIKKGKSVFTKTDSKKQIRKKLSAKNKFTFDAVIEKAKKTDHLEIDATQKQEQDFLKKIANTTIEEEKTKVDTNNTDQTLVKKRKRKRKNKVKTWEEKAKVLPAFEVSNYPRKPVKNILITQAKPPDVQNPYQLLIEKYKVQITFRPFIKVDGLSAQEFRTQKVDILEYGGVIFTSRLAIEHFFRLVRDMRIILPDSMKYFCLNEQIAYYMQKYMELRKRKIFWGQGTLDDLKTVLKKNIEKKFLLPASDMIREKVIGILDVLNAQYTAADVYKTVPEKNTDIRPSRFDMLVFFTPIAVEALKKYFPDFKQNKTRIAAYSILTANKLKELGYRVDIYAPTLEFPSMVNAIADYLLHVER